MSKPHPRLLRQVEEEFPRAFASKQDEPDPFVPGYTYGGKPIPDEFGEIPIDGYVSPKTRINGESIEDIARSSMKIRTVGELATDLARDKRFLAVENAELKKAFRKKSIEAHELRKQLKQRPTWTYTFGFAALMFFLTTLALLWIVGRPH